VPGLWEVSVGAQVVYVSEDGRYLVRGELIDLMDGREA
jgi:thiol:disulfide interchange protein DsbC